MTASLRKPSWLIGLALGASLWTFAQAVRAIEPNEILPDPKLEARARNIDRQLRCPVCQNESIDDSDADLAHDLRVLVRQRMLAGDTDAQVKQYIVDRYGNYVLLNPPFFSETYLLWLGPFVFLLAGGAIAGLYLRKTRSTAEDPPLSAEERERVATLLDDVNPEAENA